MLQDLSHQGYKAIMQTLQTHSKYWQAAREQLPVFAQQYDYAQAFSNLTSEIAQEADMLVSDVAEAVLIAPSMKTEVMMGDLGPIAEGNVLPFQPGHNAQQLNSQTLPSFRGLPSYPESDLSQDEEMSMDPEMDPEEVCVDPLSDIQTGSFTIDRSSLAKDDCLMGDLPSLGFIRLSDNQRDDSDWPA